MSEWSTTRLGDLADFRKGVKVDVLDRNERGAVPYLGAVALDTGEVTQYAKPEGAVTAEADDVLMLWDGERSGLVGGALSGVVASTVSRLRPKTNIDSSFLRHALHSKFGWIQARRTGTGVPHVPKDLSSWLSIAHPNEKDEQAAIARILDCVDEGMRATTVIVKKLKALKQGMICELLMPGGYDGDAPVETWSSNLPSGWSISRLEDLLAPVQPAMRSGPFGSALLKHELVASGVPLLGIDNVRTDKFVAEYRRFVTPAKAAELSRYRVFPDDVMITIMGTVGRTCLVPHDVRQALSSKHVWTMTFDQGAYLPYLVMTQLNHAPWALTQLRKDEQGGIMGAIRSDTLKSLLVPVPPIAEQQRITATLRAIDDKVDDEAARLDKLCLLKDGLVGALLSGHVSAVDGGAA
ncbi:restriction endonuclease subunit S [Curtobacterium sp. NPDC092190]|uniref:restriction endonuclease subunit S n=1 Tax=Curtobacterium sp. NPDC092190 TaxID=3363973 RepID=UPI0037FD977C